MRSGRAWRWTAVFWLLSGLFAAAAQPPAGTAPPPPAAGPPAAPLEVPRAAKAKPAPRALPPDAGPRPLRRPDDARLAELRRQREFQYVEGQPEVSAWDVFWARFWRWVARWLGSKSYRGFWRWVFYGLFIAAAVFVVLKLLQVDLTAAFGRSARRAPLAYDTENENIHELDFPARIAEAEAAGNWRLALRLGYLHVLKQLADAGLIRWQPDKTNHAYLRELPEAGPLRPAFRELTRQFEYVWYGEWVLTPALYQQARQRQLALRPAAQPAATR